MNEGDQRGRHQSEAMFDVCTKLACAASNIASLNIIFSPFDQLVQFVLTSFVLTICRLNVLLCRAGHGNHRKHGALYPASARAAC
jgi:hypothetical protein